MTGQGLVIAEKDLDRLEHSLRHLALPVPLQNIIESYIEKKVGKKWDDPIVLERMRTAIAAQKRDYWKEGSQRQIRYRTGYSVIAYLAYHLPVFFGQFQHLLLRLTRDGLLRDEIRILDVGSGPGVVPLAITDFFRRLGHGMVSIHALEGSDEQYEAYQFLVPGFAKEVPGIRIETPIQADLTTISDTRLPRGNDLVIFSNVQNEMSPSITEQRAAMILHRYAECLSDEGTMVIMEPADLANATHLRRISLATTSSGALSLYAPCTFLWGRRCATDRCWSFVSSGDIQPPRVMEALAQGPHGYRFLNVDMKASFALLRKDGRTRCQHQVSPGAPFLPFSELPRHIGHVVNVIAGVMSGDIGDSNHRVFLVCDGTSVKPVYVILPYHHTGNKTRTLMEAEYGDVLEFHEILVRYNRSYDAFNLLLTGRSRVIPPPSSMRKAKKSRY
ncbi:MAG: hypothetical protein LUP99_03590 [Methanomicrobiales archaeon]|nr:hypothetical protein [Methanomicrobiales archaeon]